MISIVIPTRSPERNLLGCLRALAEQTTPRFLREVIVVNDSNQLKRPKFIDFLFERLRLPLLYVEKFNGKGAAKARNHGARLTSGSLIGFLDDDSIADPRWVETVADKLSNGGVAALAGRILPLDSEGIFSMARQLRYDLRRLGVLHHGRSIDFLAGGNCVVRRSAFQSIGGFDSDFDMMHDRDLAVRLIIAGEKCEYEDKMIVYHNHHKGIVNHPAQRAGH